MNLPGTQTSIFMFEKKEIEAATNGFAAYVNVLYQFIVLRNSYILVLNRVEMKYDSETQGNI